MAASMAFLCFHANWILIGRKFAVIWTSGFWEPVRVKLCIFLAWVLTAVIVTYFLVCQFLFISFPLYPLDTPHYTHILTYSFHASPSTPTFLFFCFLCGKFSCVITSNYFTQEWKMPYSMYVIKIKYIELPSANHVNWMLVTWSSLCVVWYKLPVWIFWVLCHILF